MCYATQLEVGFNLTLLAAGCWVSSIGMGTEHVDGNGMPQQITLQTIDYFDYALFVGKLAYFRIMITPPLSSFQ